MNATTPLPDGPTAAEAAFIRQLERAKLGRWLAFIAVSLATPSLFIGFFLDDFIGRYIYSHLEGAETLYRLTGGGYGTANGVPADNHWQIEQGIAPWWTYDKLLLYLYRPLSLATHLLDARLWPNSAFFQHAHSLVWIAILVLVTTRMYRGALGRVVGGMAALLFAIDHTHGFVVGYICNRHALVTATFGVLCLDQHLRSRMNDDRRAAILAPLFYIAALLSGESAVAIAAYLFGYAMLVETTPLFRRALTFLPYFGITVVWRIAYTLAGFGAKGSGLYIDPGREPARFLAEFAQRGPVLLLGQFFAPPAEIYALSSPALSRVILIGAFVFVAALLAALIPLLRRDRIARFWLAGMVLSLVPASSTYPHNRQLLFTSFGAMALIAQLWHLYALKLKHTAISPALLLSRTLSAVVLFVHLIVSPIIAPLTTCSIAFATPLQRAMYDVGDEIAGRDVIFVTAPEYFAVKLVQLSRRVEHRPLPRHFRAISFGPQRVVVRRSAERTLSVSYEGGILGDPLMELYRDRRLRMAPGDRVSLEGLEIVVRDVTDDGRAQNVDFIFARSLDSPDLVFYYWINDGFSRFTVPRVGESKTLPGAKLRWGLK